MTALMATCISSTRPAWRYCRIEVLIAPGTVTVNGDCEGVDAQPRHFLQTPRQARTILEVPAQTDFEDNDRRTVVS
jgi:hypothetical protein